MSTERDPWRFLPNWLSISRIPLALIFAACVSIESDRWLLASLIALAALTDFLDGFLARRWNQQSDLGRILDPVADRTAFAIGMAAVTFWHMFPASIFALVLSREIVLLGLALRVRKRFNHIPESNAWGKWSTTLFAAGGIVLVLMPSPGLETLLLLILGTVLLMVATFFYVSRVPFDKSWKRWFSLILAVGLPIAAAIVIGFEVDQSPLWQNLSPK